MHRVLHPRFLANDNAVRRSLGPRLGRSVTNTASIRRADDHARDALGLPVHAHPDIAVQRRGVRLGRPSVAALVLEQHLRVLGKQGDGLPVGAASPRPPSPPSVTEALWCTVIVAYGDLACVGGHVALCTAQTQRTNAISRDGLAGGAPGASEAQVMYSGESKPGRGSRSGAEIWKASLPWTCTATKSTVRHGGRRGEVLAARLSRVTGPGSASEAGPWHGALLPGLAGPLGILAAFRHTFLRWSVGFQQGRRVAFFVAVAQRPVACTTASRDFSRWILTWP